MKFSEKWLRTLVNPELSSEQMSHLLTMAGLEVEAVENVVPAFDQVVVGKVLSVARHPNADRLKVCQVDVGRSIPLSIVCGAPNVLEGAVVPCAVVGARLPGVTIKQTSIRGVASDGMLCSAKELGLSEDGSGLMLLSSNIQVGQQLRDALDLDDRVFTLKLTPNRGDCLSMTGISREVAALTGAPLVAVKMTRPTVGTESRVNVSVDDADACPLYMGRAIDGVNAAAATPDWMVRRLERSGVRSLSVLVDITNYVMLETGQPLHAFDLNKLSGAIRVRFGRPGEKLQLLNGQVIDVMPEFLAITDASGPVALAGVMGGLSTGVSTTTQRVFLESAFFNPSVIAGRSRKLGFSSDAAHRFERGVDFGVTRNALDRGCELIVQLCGGRVGDICEAAGPLPSRLPVSLRVERARRILGIPLTDGIVEGIFKRLGFSFEMESGRFRVTPPTFRFDLLIEEDLVEEIARVYGYERLADSLPPGPRRMLPALEARVPHRQIRRAMVARDYQEIVSYTFVNTEWEADFAGNAAPIALANPIASQMSVMRSNMVGSLVECLRFNLNRKQNRVRIFELSRCFFQEGNTIRQPLRLGGLAFGSAVAEQWGVPERGVDFFDVKGDVESALDGMVTFSPVDHPAFHPGRSALISRDGAEIGCLGELHPQWCQKYELPAAPVLFELHVPNAWGSLIPKHQEISKFPAVRRDGAFVVAEGVPVGTILDTLRASKPSIVVDISLFDLYRGQGVESGEKSLAFRWLLQDTQKTLTDAEVDAAGAALREILEKEFSAKLRQ
jgi:phenylalanyl-tRNA synthetase beta chain